MTSPAMHGHRHVTEASCNRQYPAPAIFRLGCTLIG